MANILKSFLNSMKLTEDDDDFDDYLDDEKEVVKPSRQERKAQKAEANLEQALSRSSVSSDVKKEKVFRM